MTKMVKMERALGSGLERMLEAMGLEQKKSNTRYILPALGILTVGLLVGGILGRMLFPTRPQRAATPDPARKADSPRA